MVLEHQEKESFIEILDSLDIDLIPERNEPCYCGSGKKYKKCCQAKDQNPKTNLIHLEFEVTDDPFVLLDLGEPLTAEDEDRLMDCWDALNDKTSQPKEQFIEDLRALADKYQNPFVWERLKEAYESTGNIEQAKDIQREIENRFPDCLYSRFEKAAQALEEEKFEGFEECFNGRSNLPQLYPERSVFHISELILFHLQWLAYCVAILDLRRAEGHFLLLKEFLEEDDPSLLQAQECMHALYLERKATILFNRLSNPS